MPQNWSPARQEPAPQVRVIEDWARSQGSEVHCFLIDVARFGQDEREDRKSRRRRQYPALPAARRVLPQRDLARRTHPSVVAGAAGP